MRTDASSHTVLRVGLVGCGSVALAAHIPALLELGHDYRVVAIADPTVALRERARDLLGLADDRTYATHVDLLTRDDVDVVLVCTPPNVRAPILLDAIASGRHVLSEKPLSTIPRDAEQVALAARSAGIALGLVHNYLYLPEIVLAHERLRAGEIGDPQVAILNYLGVLDNPGSSDYQPGWRRRTSVAGGGVLMDMLHVVYVAEHLLGEPIERVSAWVSASEDGAPVEELALCRFETAGKAALVNIGWGFGPGGIQMSGSRGRLIVRYEGDGTSPFFPPESLTVANADGDQHFEVGAPAVPTHQLALAAFARAVRERVEPDAGGEDGYRSLSAVLAAYASAITGRTITLPLSDDDPVFREGAAGLSELEASPTSLAVRLHMFGVGGDIAATRSSNDVGA
jgi:predicted dehydrogenase